MPFAEDISAFFDTATGFAVAAVYGGLIAVDGVLDTAPTLANVGEGAQLSSSIATFYCNGADLPGVAVGVSLVASGTTYTVRDIQDDAGVLMLTLERT